MSSSSSSSGLPDTVSAESLLTAAPVPVVGMDPAGRVLFWNPAAERVFGWSADEVVGEPYPLVPEEQAEEFSTLKEQALAGQQIRGEVMERHRKDGSRVMIEVWTSPLLDDAGEIQGVIGVLHDITDRIVVEEALQRSEAQVRSLFDQAADAIMLHAPGGEIVEVNEQACRDLGYTRDELIGMGIGEVVIEAGPPAKTGRLSGLAAGERVSGLHGTHRRKDGSTFPVEAQIAMVEWEGGLLSLAIARDVTEHRRMEGELRHSQRMQALGELVGGLAHEFNNRLTTILGFTSMLLDDIGPDDPHHEDLAQVHDAASQAAELTQQLLAYGRRQMLRPVELDLNERIEELTGIVEPLLPETIEVQLELDPDVAPVHVDSGQVQQVVMNLVLNARDAMPHGGRLVLRTGSRTDPLTPDIDDDGPWTILEVEDTGAGMTPEVQERAFEPFFTTKDVDGGTGLGLSTVYGIVEQSGGHLAVDSAPGEGTTVTIALPVVQESEAPEGNGIGS